MTLSEQATSMASTASFSRSSPRPEGGAAGRGKALVVAAALMATVFSAPSAAWAQNAQLQGLERIESLEESVKEIRRVLEEDMRALRLSIEGQGGLSGSGPTNVRDQISALDSRLLRLERHIESLLRIGGLEPLQDEQTASGPVGIGAGDAPASRLNAQVDEATLWTIDSESLERNSPANQEGGAALVLDRTIEQDAASQADAPAPDAPAPVDIREDIPANVELAAVDPAIVSDSVLPDGDPDGQYKFALGKALQNDLELAEQAFAEFITRNPDHGLVADASFWLGRVQFMGGSYEKAAMTFSEFQTQWPNDSRVEKTTLWIGESVANFASQDEVCELLASLPGLIPEPTDRFNERLTELKASSNCPE